LSPFQRATPVLAYPQGTEISVWSPRTSCRLCFRPLQWGAWGGSRQHIIVLRQPSRGTWYGRWVRNPDNRNHTVCCALCVFGVVLFLQHLLERKTAKWAETESIRSTRLHATLAIGRSKNGYFQRAWKAPSFNDIKRDKHNKRIKANEEKTITARPPTGSKTSEATTHRHSYAPLVRHCVDDFRDWYCRVRSRLGIVPHARRACASRPSRVTRSHVDILHVRDRAQMLRAY
jgi:hypothetical protein